jgi:DNA polymerase III subunit delta
MVKVRMMSFNELEKKIKNKNFKSFYLLYGTENYLIDKTIESLVNNALDNENKSFNYSVYDMDETPIDLAIEDAETLPFLGDRRVVVIKNCSFLSTVKDKQEHDLHKLESYLNNPVSFSIVVFVAPFEKLDERKKIVKLLKKQAEVLVATQLDSKDINAWITSLAHQEGVTIEQNALYKLVQLLGTNLNQLTQEIKKMALFVGVEGEITEEVIDNLIARTLENDIFALVDHVIHKRMENTFRLYFDMLKQNEEPIKILALLAGQFRLVLQAKLLISKGYTEKQIAGAIKVHPYRVKLASRQCKLFSENELKAILKEIAEADFMMKTGKMDKSLIMELFFTKLNNRSA